MSNIERFARNIGKMDTCWEGLVKGELYHISIVMAICNVVAHSQEFFIKQRVAIAR